MPQITGKQKLRPFIWREICVKVWSLDVGYPFSISDREIHCVPCKLYSIFVSFISGSSVTHGSKRQTVQIFSGAKNVSLRWVTWFYNFFPGFSLTDSAVSLFLAVIVRQVLTQIPVNQMTALVRLYRCKFKYLSFVEWNS